MRRDILDWKKKSAEFCNYKCIFTGGRFQNIHHVISYNSIVDKIFSELNLERKSKISDYTNEEYQLLKKMLIKYHEETLLGACMCQELHELFHKEYTYYNSTVDDFVDFSNKIINGNYDWYFKKNNLLKNINYGYIDYLTTTAISVVNF